jgi:hypothetical protein
MRTRRPILIAGSVPASIQLRIVCWFIRRIAAISATVRRLETEIESGVSGSPLKLWRVEAELRERPGYPLPCASLSASCGLGGLEFPAAGLVLGGIRPIARAARSQSSRWWGGRSPISLVTYAGGRFGAVLTRSAVFSLSRR